jgi:hypothetical protein
MVLELRLPLTASIGQPTFGQGASIFSTEYQGPYVQDKKVQAQRNIALRDMALTPEEASELNSLIQGGKARSGNAPRRLPTKDGSFLR